MSIIDPIAYKKIESEYKITMPLDVKQAFSLKVFDSVGFPTYVDSILELRPFLNTMQDGRFKKYFEELGGLSEYESNLFIEKIKEHFIFQKRYFPNKNLIVPLDILMSGLLISRKLKFFVPEVKNIIEFGPGAGSTSMFINNYLKNLESITYVEACQTYYILQSITFDHFHGEKFKECAHENSCNVDWGFRLDKEIKYEEKQHQVHKVFHYPYFKFPEIKREQKKYDLVMANACLNEMSLDSLNLYLDEISTNLISSEGILFYQCPGLNYDGRDIVKILSEHGFAPLFLSSISCQFKFDNIYIDWKTPTPTGVFKFTGKPFTLPHDLDSMAASLGKAAFVTKEFIPFIADIQAQIKNNLSFKEFIKKLNDNDICGLEFI